MAANDASAGYYIGVLSIRATCCKNFRLQRVSMVPFVQQNYVALI
jgi:hypothetical protein